MEDLIYKAQHGDKEAFTEIFITISDDLYKIAKTRLKNEADIADAVQETMLETYKFIKKLNNLKSFKSWVFKILINKCNKTYHKKGMNDVSIDDCPDLYSKEDNISKLESDLNFYDLIKVLNHEERIVMVLYYMEDFSVKDIKNILKMNENTINTHLYRARSKIKEKYFGGSFYD